MGQRPAQVLSQAGADVTREGARRLKPGLEVLRGAGQPEGLQPGGAARRVLAEQHEVAGVGHQHEAVAPPVAADLIALRRQPGVVVSRLDLDHAAFGELSLARLPLLHLPGGVESEVGVARALLGKLADAEDLGPEGAADGVEQVGQRRVVGALACRAAGGANAAQVGEVGLDGFG